MKSSLSLFTKLLQQVFKKIMVLWFYLDLPSLRNIFFENVSPHILPTYIFIIFSVIRFLQETLQKNIWLYKYLATWMLHVDDFFLKNVWIVLILLEEKIIMKWKYLMWQNAHKWGPHKIQYIHLVKVKYDSDKTGYWIFSCPRND